MLGGDRPVGPARRRRPAGTDGSSRPPRALLDSCLWEMRDGEPRPRGPLRGHSLSLTRHVACLPRRGVRTPGLPLRAALFLLPGGVAAAGDVGVPAGAADRVQQRLAVVAAEAPERRSGRVVFAQQVQRDRHDRDAAVVGVVSALGVRAAGPVWESPASCLRDRFRRELMSLLGGNVAGRPLIGPAALFSVHGAEPVR